MNDKTMMTEATAYKPHTMGMIRVMEQMCTSKDETVRFWAYRTKEHLIAAIEALEKLDDWIENT